MTDRQTADRQTRQCAKGTTDSTVGQKSNKSHYLKTIWLISMKVGLLKHVGLLNPRSCRKKIKI